MTAAKRTPRYVDIVPPAPVASRTHDDVIPLHPRGAIHQPATPAPMAAPHAPALVRSIADARASTARALGRPVARRPWRVLLVPPNPGAATRAFDLPRWKARAAIGAMALLVVLIIAAVSAVVAAVRDPDLLSGGSETMLLRAELQAARDSLADARASVTELEQAEAARDSAEAAAPKPIARGREPLIAPRARVRSRLLAPRVAASSARIRAEGLPAAGVIVSRFTRARRHPVLHIVRPHLGVDVAARRGTPVYAQSPGRVISVKRGFAYGLMVEIDHGGGITTRYAHLQSTSVSEGQEIHRGELVASVGSSGLTTGPHLHYEVLVRGHQVDPLRFQLPQPQVAMEPASLPAPVSAVGTHDAQIELPLAPAAPR